MALYRRQMTLDPTLKPRLEHGGSHARGHRKELRPIATKRVMHLVLRAERARGKLSLLQPRHHRYIRTELARQARRFAVRIEAFANSGTHLHLAIRAKTRDGFQKFLRAFAGHVAQFVTGARRGRPFGSRFWDELAYSRIVAWGKALTNLRRYIRLNELEAKGIVAYEPRPERTKRLRDEARLRRRRAANF